MNPVVAMTTTNSEREAKKLAALLVKERLAACVQIMPKINSIYEWEGEVHDDQEYLLLIKTREERIKGIKAALAKHHSYEIPEFVVVPIIDGTEEYFKWMEEMTR